MTGQWRARLCAALLLSLLFSGCALREKPDKTVIVLRDAAVPAASAVPGTRAEDWYGWWRMDRCTGDWAHMAGYYWDCCAELEADAGALRLRLWDEDITKDVGLAEVRLTERDGALRCDSGSFLDRALGPEDWTVTETHDDCGALLHLKGYYRAVGNGGFRCELFLRPWGSLWPGREDEKPGFYDSWYLPLIDRGAPMPDKIG